MPIARLQKRADSANIRKEFIYQLLPNIQLLNLDKLGSANHSMSSIFLSLAFLSCYIPKMLTTHFFWWPFG